MDFGALVVNFILTGVAYLAVPLIVGALLVLNRKAMTKKGMITMICVNAFILYVVFTVINDVTTGFASANIAATFIWSFVGYFILKKMFVNRMNKREMALCERIFESAVDASEQFLSYLKEDSYLYGKCINDNPIKTTSAIFVVNLYRERLNKYGDHEQAFVTMYTVLGILAPDKSTHELFVHTHNEYMKMCHECIEFSKNDPDFDVIDVLTKVYFSLVIDDREYLMQELEDSIPQSVSFRKIYNYIYGIINHSVIHQENNMTCLRRTLDIK